MASALEQCEAPPPGADRLTDLLLGRVPVNQMTCDEFVSLVVVGRANTNMLRSQGLRLPCERH